MQEFREFILVTGENAHLLAAVSEPYPVTLTTGEPSVFRKYNTVDGLTLSKKVMSLGDFSRAIDKNPAVVKHLPTGDCFIVLYWGHPDTWEDKANLLYYLKAHPEARMKAAAIHAPSALPRNPEASFSRAPKRGWWRKYLTGKTMA